MQRTVNLQPAILAVAFLVHEDQDRLVFSNEVHQGWRVASLLQLIGTHEGKHLKALQAT